MTTMDDIESSLNSLQDAIANWAVPQYIQVSASTPLEKGLYVALLDNEDERARIIEQRLHDALSRLQKIHTKLASQQNRIAGINELPVEILCTIFKFFCADMPPEPPLGALPLGFTLWKVCQYWRAILCEQPTVWSKLDVTYLDDTSYHALRELTQGCTVDCPLNITIQPGLAFVQSELLRIVDLNLELPSSLAQSLIISSPHTSPLEMESLTVYCPDTFEDERPTQTLEAPLFGGYADKLRYLKLYGIRLPWATGFYRNLTTLDLEVTHGEPGATNALDRDICAFLDECPNLTTISLSITSFVSVLWWTPNQDGLLSISPPRTKRVHLGSLVSISLNMPATYVFRILSSISADAVKDLEIVLEFLDEEEADFVPLLVDPDNLSSALITSLTEFRVNDINNFATTIKGRGLTEDGVWISSFRLEWSVWRGLPSRIETGVEVSRRVAHVLRGHPLSSRLRSCELSSWRDDGIYSDIADRPFFYLAQIPSPAVLHFHRGVICPSLPATLCATHNFANLTTLITQTVIYEQGALIAVAEWCAALPKLQLLDLQQSYIGVDSMSDIESLLRRVQGLQVKDINWTECVFWTPHGDPDSSLAEVWPADLRGYEKWGRVGESVSP